MSFGLGVLLFALGIGVSVALHEAGHLATAKAFGMKVTRYFIGFGPKIFSFRCGETEYGLKVIPAGGFCQIVGMTALEEVEPADAPRAFFRQRVWKRVVVLAAGSLTHFIIGIVVLFAMAVSVGLPNDVPLVAQVSPCVSNQNQSGGTLPCGPGAPAPALAAGIRPGDRIVAVAGQPTPTVTDLQQVTKDLAGPTPVTVERDGQRHTLSVDIARVKELQSHPNGSYALTSTGVIGVVLPTYLSYRPLPAVPATLSFTGTLFADTWQGLEQLPREVPALITAVTGGPRGLNTPISVYGASRLGGQLAQDGLWQTFLYLLAALNFFVGVFNLLPLLPLDGGHIVVALYERVRDGVRRLTGRRAGGPVDYTKLLPLTYLIILVGGAYVLLTLTADIVNPVSLPVR